MPGLGSFPVLGWGNEKCPVSVFCSSLEVPNHSTFLLPTFQRSLVVSCSIYRIYGCAYQGYLTPCCWDWKWLYHFSLLIPSFSLTLVSPTSNPIKRILDSISFLHFKKNLYSCFPSLSFYYGRFLCLPIHVFIFKCVLFCSALPFNFISIFRF